MTKWSIVCPSLFALALAACGGGEGGGASSVASTPPPIPAPSGGSAPPPSNPHATSETQSVTPIASPATRGGTYDAIALVEGQNASGVAGERVVSPGQVRITAEPGSGQYTLTFAAADVPVPSAKHEFPGFTLNYLWNDAAFGNVTSIVQTYSDGTSKAVSTKDYRRGESTIETATGPSTKLRQTLVYDVGLSYVALGEWAWRTVEVSPTGGEAIGSPIGRVLFVNGDRTPAAAIPTSGTATYKGASLGYDTDSANRDFPGFGGSVDVTLTTDFGHASISAQLKRDYSVNGDAIGGYLTTLGVDAQGNAAIGLAGGFAIPLSGTLTNDTVISPVTGSLDGAFFGPHAEQVGGVFALGQTPGVPLVSDAFVGVKN